MVRLTAPPDDQTNPSWTSAALAEIASPNALTDDDLQLALHIIYELSYRGYAEVDDAWEWDLDLLALRGHLERQFERELRRRVDERGLVHGATSVDDVLRRGAGPSLSTHVALHATLEQFVEFAIHRSAYQLKEADPHSWALPRISGPRKAALVAIQSDEYGQGDLGQAHADLFAVALDAMGVDSAYGALIDRIPGVTLATGNLISLLGTQQRLRAALLGHLAAFELTSVQPMSRYAAATHRLGLDERVRRFFTVHVEADEHHGALAQERLVGGDPEADGLPVSEICFGAAALSVVEDGFARHLLRSWSVGESSLRPHEPATQDGQ